MARPLRIELSGGLYHVTSRGDRREDIYFSNADREAWLTLLGQVCERFHWRCHAYCQMTNHYQWQPPEYLPAQSQRITSSFYLGQWVEWYFPPGYCRSVNGRFPHNGSWPPSVLAYRGSKPEPQIFLTPYKNQMVMESRMPFLLKLSKHKCMI
jgi:hypothetical protein